MSVSLSRSPSFCSHSSSPSCSPSPHRIKSPSSTRKAGRPQSKPTPPLPFLLTKADKFVLLGSGSGADGLPSSSHQQLPNVTASSSSAALASTSESTTATPVRRSHRSGGKDASRVAKRKQVILPATASSHPMVMSSTPIAHTNGEIKSASWTRRRGMTAESERVDSSSGSELEGESARTRDESTELSPGPTIDRSNRAYVSDGHKASKAGLKVATPLEGEGVSIHPKAMHPGMAAFLSSTHGLERNFEAKVSMTPPARTSNKHNESPFNCNGLLAHPATESKRNSIPRSHAFGPLAPLPLHDHHGLSSKASRRGVALHSHPALGIDGLPFGGAEGESSLDYLQAIGTVDGYCHARAQTEGAAKRINRAGISFLEKVQEPRRRATTMLKSSTNHNAMEVDEESEENDEAPPPSPSPAGDLSFPKRFNISEEESATESDSEGNLLRPGARLVSHRLGSGRSISTSQCQHEVPSMVGLGGEIPVRSFTTSALKNTSQSSLSSSSSTKLGSQTCSLHNKSSSSSPYKTPNKRRARIPSSTSGPRVRTLSAVSPIAAPLQSEEGSLFGGIAGADVEEDCCASNWTSRENKRRSTGSFLPTTPGRGGRLFSEASPAASLSSPSRSSNRSPRLPTSPTTGSQRKTALNRLDNSFAASPNAITFGFDDSGVAFSSPALSDDKLTERALGKHLGLTSLARSGLSTAKMPETPAQASPSKAALTRRSASEQQPHPFSVRERSALANETRMSDGGSSVTSSPDVMRRASRTMTSANSVPENIASPVRRLGARRTSLSASFLAADESTTTTQPYLTPQNYKNVVPLQAAFMSTGLASKRSRPSMGNTDLVTGETLPPLPPQPNYSLGGGGSISSTTQLGLREVMAAANAHSAASSKPATMPDTPMKKPVFPSSFASHGSKATPVEGPKVATRSQPTFPAMLSPSLKYKAQCDGAESSSSGGSAYEGDSPLLNQECDSPTLGLASLSGKHAWTPGPRRIQSPFKLTGSTVDGFSQSLSPPKAPAGFSTSPEINLPDDKDVSGTVEDVSSSKRSSNRPNSPSAMGLSRPAVLRGKSAIMNRPALGLQRKSSFGPASEQGLSLNNSVINSPVLGTDFIPTTPTRNSASIKWFEAAQLVTTPSPSSRRRDSRGRPESYQTTASNRSSRLRLSVGAMDGPAESSGRRAALGLPKVFHFESRFTVQSSLGRGEFSQVDKVEDKMDGCLYAVKRMKKPYLGPRDRLRRLEEVDILNHLSKEGGHLNIISLVDAWEESGSLFIQTELCPCVDFSSFLQYNSNMGGALEEARLWKVFKELSDGLRYMHDLGVLHLDLKPANIFITEIATLKIGDFGLATRWPTVDANTILAGAGMGDECNAEGQAAIVKKGKNLEREGDREYIAPEIIFEGRYGKAADVFSLGLVLLEAAGNVVLPDNGEAWQKLRNDDLRDVDLSIFSTSLIRLMQACLQSKPEKRPTMEEVQRHPVLLAVGRRVALGVQVSELDQLPIFDLPSGDSSRSLASKFESVDDLEMVDREDPLPPKTPKGAERSTSACSGLGLLGIEGSAEGGQEKVLDIRGALIHESIDFLIDILEAEPDPTARLTGNDDAFIPTVTIEGVGEAEGGERQQQGLSATAGLHHHQPFRASPLRQEDEEEGFEMEVDRDDDIFIP